jgi:hypothetical protein
MKPRMDSISYMKAAHPLLFWGKEVSSVHAQHMYKNKATVIKPRETHVMPLEFGQCRSKVRNSTSIRSCS